MASNVSVKCGSGTKEKEGKINKYKEEEVKKRELRREGDRDRAI